MRGQLALLTVIAGAPAHVAADKYGLDEVERSEGGGVGVLVFGVGLVATVNAWHRYNKDGASATEAMLQAAIGAAFMWAGASMK